MPDPLPTDDPLTNAQQLGASYAALLGGKEWEIDTPVDFVPEEIINDVPPPPIPAPVPTKPIQHEPPVAEAANEPTVPPTPLQIIEALLFVGGHPLRYEEATDAIRGLALEQFHDYINALNRVYRSQLRPYEIVPQGDGYVMRLASRHASIREKLYGGPREARLNQTALDVLALVAYRQPVGKDEIDTIRGADSSGIMRQLVRLGLIGIVHRDDADAKIAYYGTTSRFLEIFRLRDLDDLPKLGEPKKLS